MLLEIVVFDVVVDNVVEDHIVLFFVVNKCLSEINVIKFNLLTVFRIYGTPPTLPAFKVG